MDEKTKKKKLLSQILKELEVVLHGAVDVGIEKNLSPYEMILVSIQTLYDRSNKKKKDLANQKPLAKVFHFPTKNVDRVSDELFDGLNRNDDDDKNGA
jgi:hypothetical protein